MQNKQVVVLWMGLILVFLRGVTQGQFQTLWSTASTAPTKAKTSSTTSSNSTSESGYTGAVTAV